VAKTLAQYPNYFQYNNENGLPSNEVYSILQDNKGFIWIGSDAGLFKFDGVSYIPYKSETQTIKAITGLTISSSGRLYCYNFQTQIFYLEDDQLKELKHPLPKYFINNLASDREGNIFATYMGGIARYSEKTKQWTNFFDYGNIKDYDSNEWNSKSVNGNKRHAIQFVYSKGIAEVDGETQSGKDLKWLYRSNSPFYGNFEIDHYQDALWIIEKESGNIYRFAHKKLEKILHTPLNKVLAGKKVTVIKALPDGNLWICTYKGIIKFNQKANTAELYYPQYSFSDCMIDLEGNYWFTTLQNGIIRVPDFSFKVWNEYTDLTRISGNNSQLYFADAKGKIIQFDIQSEESKIYHQGFDADIQSFDYDRNENALFFNINNHLFKLKNNQLSKTDNFGIKAIKSVKTIDGSSFALSSHGVFIDGKQVHRSWARRIQYDSLHKNIWIASNDGLLNFKKLNHKWYLSNILIKGTQILSIDFDHKDNLLYALTFSGKVFAINSDIQAQEIIQIPENIQVNKLISFQNKLYIGTNSGIGILDKATKKINFFNHLSGLISNNVQDFTISQNSLWIASIKGLQEIPLNKIIQQIPLSKIYLKNPTNKSHDNYFNLKYSDNLILYPEVVHYSSNGNFEYAYRINNKEWLKLPANIEQIKLQNLPSGMVTIEIKAIDFMNRDSQNSILIKGYVNPPFYKSWWFISLCTLFFLGLVYLIFMQQWKKHKRKLQLENEINLLKLTAVKSQMNPHFIFNVLSSIKGYIYENDRKKATTYLDDFSDLIRTILEKSEKQFSSLTDEINTIKLYIELEGMMFDDFDYEIKIDDNLDTDSINIPSLLLQPYIENAFKHGLRHKKADKKLIVSAYINEKKQCIIEIMDNGIGRKKAEELNKSNTLKRQSFATSAMEKRMNILNQQLEQKITIDILDFWDEQQNSTGTKVIFTLQ
jgi:ligand-binding sensor domain-containing protein